MAISDWPVAERPREKLLERGAAALSDAELLAIFLRTGLPGRSALDLARDLLTAFGGLRPLLEADLRSFSAHKGLGSAKFVQLQATLELARRHLAEQLSRGVSLEDPDTVRHYLAAQLRDRKNEVFAVLFLDNRHRVIAFEELFQGSIDSASVHPRVLVQRALAHNASALILAHNHPSGIAEPSRSDELVTAQIVSAMRLVDVRVLDHFVVGDGVITSFAERGLL